MTTPKSKYPIESFAPELMQILKRAGLGETITLKFPQRRLARRFQMRLHMLRGRMRATDHPDFTVVTRARTSLKGEGGPDDPATLTIHQYDSEFKDIISEAEIKGPTQQPTSSSPTIAAPKLDRDPLEDL